MKSLALYLLLANLFLYSLPPQTDFIQPPIYRMQPGLHCPP